jgi:hypothetical protein
MRQRQEEGYDVGPLVARYARLQIEGTDNEGWLSFYRQLEALPPPANFPYDEPADLDAIRATRAPGPRRLSQSLPADELERRILGAWLGRCAGCTLGKPRRLVPAPDPAT